MKRRKKSGGSVQIYSPHTPYPQQGVGSDSIESINKNLTSSLIQSQANAQYDKLASKGGSRNRHHRVKTKTKRRVK
jgi:hypothetical protein